MVKKNDQFLNDLNLNFGDVLRHRWRLTGTRLGAGVFGSVYEVEDMKEKGELAAMKIEKNVDEDNSLLKIEAKALQAISTIDGMVHYLDGYKKKNFQYIVITLCGPDLMRLKVIEGINKFKDKRLKKRYSEETSLRIGILALYQIKKLHEVGFIHRDLKPGNMTVCADNAPFRHIYVIDFGMVRRYVTRQTDSVILKLKEDDSNTNKDYMRQPRDGCLLRGTTKYCSIDVQLRKEQGRVDDLWSLLYSLIEFQVGLPWGQERDQITILKMKQNTSDEVLYKNCPQEYISIANHLKTLTYYDKPKYNEIYKLLCQGLIRCGNVTFLDPMDWEDENEVQEEITKLVSDKKIDINTPRNEELCIKLYPCFDPKHFA
ncbi:Asator [Strongyloides ratti]|uniref:non-specific serine/threonine protein kinase n=1 Tax=Strongyloides ratti TaxID=34506 RepID=A0A090LAG9_STRRB|nr:Asator [Strongyloides ratti]CEF65133.1 Asator [Strongyloides ratti]